MAKTDVHPAPSSPLKQGKVTATEPELVAAQEVVGREISIFQGLAKHPEWWDGKVVDFNADTAEHLIRYHRDHSSEQWLQLSSQPFQWKGKAPSSSAPNPTVKGVKLNDSILGRKVKVFWPTMSKWYLGCIKEYNAQAGRHTIKYKDGEVKDHALRNEAVWWLDSTGAKGSCSSPTSKGHSTASRGNSPDARQNSRRRARATVQGSETTSSGQHAQQHSTTAETSHTHTTSKKDVKSGTAATAERTAAEPQTAAAQTDIAAKGKAESGAAADRDRHSGIFAAASGNVDTDAENGYASQHSQLHDCAGESASMQEEEEQSQDHVPSHAKSQSHRTSTLRKGRSQDWTQLAGEGKTGRKGGTLKGGEGRGVLDEPGAGDSIIGARVGIFWEDDQTYYKGQLAGFDAYHKRSKVCYDDGQEEWISLTKERFRWLTPRGLTSKHYNARMKSVMQQLDATDPNPSSAPLDPSSTPTQTLVPEGSARSNAPHATSASARQPAMATAVPQAAAAVGWGLSIYSQAEEMWVKGEVLSWNSRQGLHHLLYEDGEDEWLKLGKEHVQWHSPTCSISGTAGLQQGEGVPEGRGVVGWRVGVYWRDDHKFYLGEVAAYNEEEDLYEVFYDDNEREDVSLSEQPMKWLLPPGLSTTGEPPNTHPRPKRATSRLDSHPRLRRQPTSRRLAQDRGLEKQKSRLGVSRRNTGIQKVSAPKAQPSLLPVLRDAITSPATFLAPDPSTPQATAAPPATAAAGLSSSVPTAAAPSEPATAKLPVAVAPRIPPQRQSGSSANPHIDRVIALTSRRAPHLAGTRVKIFCSQGGKGVKSSRPLCASGTDSSAARRVKQRVEALDLMIWRCECARKVITKGAPIPVSTLSGPQQAKPQAAAQSAPAARLITNQVAARLGVAHSMPASAQLPAPSSTSIAAGHLPSSSQPEAADGAQLPADRQYSPEASDLIHQLPGSSPMLQDASLILSHSAPSDLQQHGESNRLTAHPSQQISTFQSASGLHNGSQHVSTKSRSSSAGLPSVPSPSRQKSPASASLAGLIPPTTAVTVPSSSQSQAPYGVISAAAAASIGDHTVPVVTSQAAYQLPTSSEAAQDCSGAMQLPHASLSQAMYKLPELQKTLKAQDSIGTPDTPDTDMLERHAALHREHSSFSKGATADGLQHDHSTATLKRKEVLTTSGLLDLAMSDVPPTEELEPDMIAAFLADGDVFSDKPGA